MSTFETMAKVSKHLRGAFPFLIVMTILGGCGNGNGSTGSNGPPSDPPEPLGPAVFDPSDPANEVYATSGGPCPAGVYCTEDKLWFSIIGGTSSGDCSIALTFMGGGIPGFRCVESDTENEFGKKEAIAMEYQVPGESGPYGVSTVGPVYEENGQVVLCSFLRKCDEFTTSGETIRSCSTLPKRLVVPDMCEHSTYIWSAWDETDSGGRCYSHESIQGCFVPASKMEECDICGEAVSKVSSECAAAIEKVRVSLVDYLNTLGFGDGIGCMQNCIMDFVDCMEDTNCDGSIPCENNSSSCMTGCII